MKRAILGLIVLAIAASAVMAKAKPVQVDPDYCAGIACTEETDSCCDETVPQ